MPFASAALSALPLHGFVTPACLQSAIASYGQPNWGLSLLSITAVNPKLALNTGAACINKFGSFCLDHSSLTVVEIEVIIAIGAIVLVMLLAVPCVLLEWRRKSGMVRPPCPAVSGPARTASAL